MPSAARAKRGKGTSAKGNRASRGMAGIMWRQCVVVLVFLAWQIMSAGAMVNMIEPRVAPWAPQTDQYLRFATSYWQLFDNDISTYVDVGVGERVRVSAMRTGALRATKVRITLAAHAREQDVPLLWFLRGAGGPGRAQTRSPIKNGVFEFNYEVVQNVFQIKHEKNKSRKSVPIAEIELLGPRKALDALWPHGNYPCSQRLEMITPLKGELFSVAKNTVSKKTLSQVFSSDVERDLTLGLIRPYPQPFMYDGSEPVIIGVKFANPIPTVHQVMVHGFRWYILQGVERVVLEAHKCKPNCSNDGTKGWVKLGEERPLISYNRFTLLDSFKLKTAGKYKAYRLKFYRRQKKFGGRPLPEMMEVSSIFFLGCKA